MATAGAASFIFKADKQDVILLSDAIVQQQLNGLMHF